LSRMMMSEGAYVEYETEVKRNATKRNLK